MYGDRGRQQWRPPPSQQQHQFAERGGNPDEGRRDRRRAEDWEVPRSGYYYEHDDRDREEDRPRRGGYPQGGGAPHQRGIRNGQPGHERRPPPKYWEDSREARPGDPGEGQYSPTRHSEPAGKPARASRDSALERVTARPRDWDRDRDRERSPPPFERQLRGRGQGSGGYGRPYYDEHDHRDSDRGPASRGRRMPRRGSPGGKWKHDMFEKVAAADEEQPGAQKEQERQPETADQEEAAPDQSMQEQERDDDDA